MQVNYRGVAHNLPPKLEEKFKSKCEKLARLLDGPKGEKSAHVVVTHVRHLQKAEITLRVDHHQLVAICSDADLFTAMSAALAKLEIQALKQKGRGREKIRRQPVPKIASANSENLIQNEAAGPRVFRPKTHERRKPLTLDEAILLMDDGRGYLVYRDTEQERLNILVRRTDGHFDLIEA
jgi:putative sigma-54 modulation protein